LLFIGKRATNSITTDDKPKNRLKDDTKNNLNKYNFNMNKRRGKGLMSGNGSFDPTMNTVNSIFTKIKFKILHS
jgi:hypothetical protein